MRLLTAILAVCVAFIPASTLSADITFNVIYDDVNGNSNFGFDDPTLGATRRSTVNAVLDYINTVVDHTGSADIQFLTSNNAPGSGTLASAGPLFFSGPAGFTNGFLFDHATSGNDPFAGAVDAQARVNFGRTWNSGLGGPAGNEFDLFSVLLHEISHAMGYLSFLEANGNGQGSGNNVYSVYDSFLERGNGTQLFSGINFVGSPADLTSGDLFFDGAGARAGNNGNPVEVYAPSSFNSGSSIGHLDPGAHSGSVMNPGIAPGVTKRVYSSEDLGVLSDIGWTLKAVPEPGTMVIWSVLGGTAFWVRIRRRRKSGETTASGMSL